MFHSVKTRIIATFLIAVTLVIIVGTVVAFQTTRLHEHAISDDRGSKAAQTCAMAVQLSIENYDEFKPGTKDYDDCRQVLRTLCKSLGMTYMYAYALDLEKGTSTYLMVAAANDDEDAYITRVRPYGTVVEAEVEQTELDALKGIRTTNAIEYNNQFGHMLDWVALAEEDHQVLAAASYSVSAQYSNVFTSTVRIVAPFIGALLVLLVVQLIILQRHFIKPINVVAERMRSFSADRVRSYEPIGLKSHDELEEISNAFDGMVAEIGAYLNDIEAMTAAKVQTDVELSVAQRIQQGMVPATTGVEGMAGNVFAISRPAREIGGDFYDIVQTADGATSIIIGDVSGKGMAAALFMAMSKEMIRIGLANGRGPAETLNAVNARLCDNNPEGMFVTAMIASLHEDGTVVLANAGHLPPIRVGRGAELVECSPGCLLGLFDDVCIEDEHLELEPGEALVLYTDGASEAVNAKREFLGIEAIVDTLANRAPFGNVWDILGEIVGAVDGFAAQTVQFDDLTAIAVMRRGIIEVADAVGVDAEGKALDVSLASFDEVKRAILDGDNRRARLRACLACEEAFANIVSYSGAQHAYYDVHEAAGKLVVVLEDDGAPFDPLMTDPIEKEFEELDSGGMGISLVKSIADELSYRRSGGRNILTMTFDLAAE